MYGNKIASQNLFTSLKIWRTILNASAVCACMHHHQDQWITAAAGLNTMIAQQPHTSSRAREHGADVCHASLVMQVMCVWTVKKCHGFMWKQTLVASDRKSRHPLHPPTSDSWLLCPWVTVGTHHCWPHGLCHFCDSLTVITWRRRKAKHRAQKMKHVMAVSDVIKPDKRQKKKTSSQTWENNAGTGRWCRERQSINHPSILTCTSLSGLWADRNLSQLS